MKKHSLLSVVSIAALSLAGGAYVPSAAAATDAWNEGAPRINGARAFGATPGRSFRYAFPTCGAREGLRFSVAAGVLPEGAALDEKSGLLSGRVAQTGEYPFTVRATNRQGEAQKRFTLVVRPGALMLTPPMGWTSWSAYTDDVRQEHIAASAKALVEKGLAARGYSFVNVDSCWQGNRTAKDSLALQPNGRFPDMKGLVDGIHALGLKAGIYSTPMVIAWGSDDRVLYHGGTGYPLDPKSFDPYFGGCGQVGFEKVDAAQFAAWGFDWLKYDWPVTDVEHAQKMRQALDAADRDIVLQLCTGCSRNDAEKFPAIASLVRGNLDTHDKWDLMLGKHQCFHGADRWLGFIRPGFWYDLDMLAVGAMRIDRKESSPRPGEKPPASFANKLTRDEQTSHFAWWAILPAPLFLSCNVEHMDDFTLGLVSNEELIEINQDYPATPASFEDLESGRRRIWTRRLSDGRTVLGFFNLGEDEWHVTRLVAEGRRVRDVISKADLGRPPILDLRLSRHACRVFVVSGD